MALPGKVNECVCFASDFKSLVLDLKRVEQQSDGRATQVELLSSFLDLGWDESKEDICVCCIACRGALVKPSRELSNDLSLHKGCFIIMALEWTIYCSVNEDGFDNMLQAVIYGTDQTNETDHNWYKMAKKYFIKELLSFHDLGNSRKEQKLLDYMWPRRLNDVKSRIFAQLEGESNKFAMVNTDPPDSVVQQFIEGQDAKLFDCDVKMSENAKENGLSDGHIWWWHSELAPPNHLFALKRGNQQS